MAINGRFTVSMEEAFPEGLFVTSEVEPVRDFEKSSREAPVQALDKESGLRLWEFTVADPDPAARKNSRQLTVKIAAEHQPVPPEAIGGTPFRPVVLEGLEVRPYIKDGPRPSIAYSIRASGMRAPQSVTGSAGSDATRRPKASGVESAGAA
jgi:hypothetical protein